MTYVTPNAHLVPADGCFCNMFAAHGGNTAEKALNDEGLTLVE